MAVRVRLSWFSCLYLYRYGFHIYITILDHSLWFLIKQTPPFHLSQSLHNAQVCFPEITPNSLFFLSCKQGTFVAGKYKCLLCQKEFVSESGVKYHINSVHAEVRAPLPPNVCVALCVRLQAEVWAPFPLGLCNCVSVFKL